MRVLDKFKAVTGDDYWDCDDTAEELTHDDPASAVEYHVDSWLSPTCDVESVIREKFADGLTVYAWRRNIVTDDAVNDAAESLICHAEEYFADTLELGSPDGTDFGSATKAKHLPAFAAAVRALYADVHVWSCEQFAEVELSCEELLELCRSEFPHWFEVTP